MIIEFKVNSSLTPTVSRSISPPKDSPLPKKSKTNMSPANGKSSSTNEKTLNLNTDAPEFIPSKTDSSLAIPESLAKSFAKAFKSQSASPPPCNHHSTTLSPSAQEFVPTPKDKDGMLASLKRCVEICDI